MSELDLQSLRQKAEAVTPGDVRPYRCENTRDDLVGVTSDRCGRVHGHKGNCRIPSMVTGFDLGYFRPDPPSPATLIELLDTIHEAERARDLQGQRSFKRIAELEAQVERLRHGLPSMDSVRYGIEAEP